ncbi:MAG: class I SAM-dependent RNA methyltransferase [Candidatus Binataceae bacterium]
MVQVRINAMTFGPYAVGDLDGKRVMVPHAAPGDLLEVAPANERRDYTVAKLARVLVASNERRPPPCPYLPRCGGCDWQHLQYAAQVRFKGELIAAEFRRVFDLELDPATLVIPAPDEFGYRSRIRLKTDGDGKIGFHEPGSHRLVAVEHCLLAGFGLEQPARLARALGRHCIEIEAVDAGGALVLIARLRDFIGAEAASRRLLETGGAIRGIVLRNESRREIIGDAAIAVELEPGLELIADADQFSQINRGQNQRLIAAVMDLAEISGRLEVLDLFCGAGNFSLPAARRGARVTGVDSDASAIAAGNRNAARMRLGETQFIAMRAAELAHFFERARFRPEIVILDPPRSGALALMEKIARLRPRAVIYVSCDLSTLMRDLAALKSRGYDVARVRAFDFFPNTHHAEIAARAVLT